MKQRLVQIREKLASRRAETLAELLVSVLVISLGLTMFATALMSARRMLARSNMVFQSYYTGRNLLEDEADEAKDDTAEIILEKEPPPRILRLRREAEVPDIHKKAGIRHSFTQKLPEAGMRKRPERQKRITAISGSIKHDW